MEGLDSPSNPAFDLAVIGAGPAGSSAAITAARAGIRVLLLERGRFPRQRVCGEFVSAESLELLTTLLAERAPSLIDPAPRISRARLFAEGRTIRTTVNPPAASIARIDVDLALWNAAEQLGVRTLSQTTVEQIFGKGPFRLTTSAGEFSALALINATGRWSNLTRPGALPHDNSGARWLGVKAHFTEPDPSPSVDLYFFEGGYCGVQPVRVASEPGVPRINACAMVRSDLASTLPEVFAQHPALAERSRNWQRLMDPVSTSPLVFRDPAPLRNGVFLAGDSAGFVDPFVGDGISLALRSGSAAAQCLLPFLRGEMNRAEAEQRYAESYHHRLLPIFRNSQRLRRLFKLPRPIRRPLAYFFEHTPALTSYLVSKTR
jgi:flavin-dependent dehydrogenase